MSDIKDCLIIVKDAATVAESDASVFTVTASVEQVLRGDLASVWFYHILFGSSLSADDVKACRSCIVENGSLKSVGKYQHRIDAKGCRVQIGDRVGSGTVLKLSPRPPIPHSCTFPPLYLFQFGDLWKCDCGRIWEHSVTSLDERGAKVWQEMK